MLTATVLMSLCLISIAISVKIQKNCIQDNCSGPFRIKTLENTAPIVSVNITKGVITKWDEEVELVSGKRRRLSIYCYDGSSIDPNTGCEEQIRNFTLLPNDLRRLAGTGLCPYGHECHPDGDCTGSDAKICYNTEVSDKKSPVFLRYSGARYMVFPKHTCVTSWECFIVESKVKTFVRLDERGYGHPYFYTKHGTKVDLDYEFYEKGFEDKDGLRYTSKSKSYGQNIFEVEMKCYSRDVNDIKCTVTNQGSPYKDLIFNVDGNLRSTFRNMKLEIRDPISSIKEGKMVKIYPTNNGQPHPTNNIIDYEERSVDRESLIAALNNIEAIQMQSLYNIIKEHEIIEDIVNILNIVIVKMSHMNPRIIGEILGSKSSTNWLTDEYFELCPCYDPVIPENTSCFGMHKKKFDKFLKEVDETTCYHHNFGKYTNVSFVQQENSVDVEKLEAFPPKTSNSDSESWDSLNEMLIESSQAHNENNYVTKQFLEGLMEDIDPLTKLERIIGKWGGMLGTASFVIHVIMLLRNR